ncbi:MAG TPA: hypothetical protein VFI65_16995 [Streptosporangiaceae bacterium]|nr:hypothetical protein [Streptosporangiaceae bacterium]
MRDTGQSPAQTTDRHEPGTDQGKGDRKNQRVGIIGVLSGAARYGRRHWWRILIVAVAVSMITVLAELTVEELVPSDTFPWSLIAGLTASGLSLLGAVFMSGFLTKLVAHSEEVDRREGNRSGDKDHGISIKRVLRTLPWGRLIGADVLITLIVVIGLILLIIPGLIAFNLLALAGPVIEVENRKIAAALRRSMRLVRGHFWTVALLATLPIAVASEIEVAAPNPDSIGEFFQILAIRGLAEGIAEAIIGLILVQLTHRLIALDKDRSARSEAERTH